LYAAHWCISNVDNGGLLQFFWNSTGILAPEAREGFTIAGLKDLARVLEEASNELLIERDRFATASGVLDECARLDLIRNVEGLLLESPAGVRGLAGKVPSVAALARSASVRSLVDPVLGSLRCQSHLRALMLPHERSWRPVRDPDDVQRLDQV
jgi:hypothetical protein